MTPPTAPLADLTSASRRVAKRLVAAGGNRLEILAVELREERDRVLRAFFLALAAATFGLLACLSLTATLTVILWTFSPWAALVGLTLCYAAIALALGLYLRRLLRTWTSLPETIDQLRKDRECLDQFLG